MLAVCGVLLTAGCDDVCPAGTIEIRQRCEKFESILMAGAEAPPSGGSSAASAGDAAVGGQGSPASSSGMSADGAGTNAGATGSNSAGMSMMTSAGQNGGDGQSPSAANSGASGQTASAAGSSGDGPSSGSAASGGAGASGPADCQDGETSCDGLVVRQCSDGRWITGSPCSFLCKDGDCGGECEPGAKRCADNVPQTCDAGATWMNTAAACSSVCVEGACSGTCVPDTKQCNGNRVQTCSASGAWNSGEPCMFVCTGGACGGECTPNELRCSGLAREKCNAQGVWQPNGANCPNLCTDGACTGECKPNQQRCSGLSPQKCDERGMWQQNGAACPNLCNAGACTGDCKPLETRCSGSNNTLQQTCSTAGKWSTGTIKPPCAECDPSMTPACMAGTTKLRTCSAGKFVDEVSKTCGAECTPGEGGCEYGGVGKRWGNCSFSGTDPENDTMASFTCKPDGTGQPTAYCHPTRCADGTTLVAALCTSTVSGASCSTVRSCP